MAAKKKAKAKAKPKGQKATLYFREPEAPENLYRLETAQAVAAPGGGLDLSEIPPGKVTAWDGAQWVDAELPVGVKHTKNTAGVGVG